MCPGFLLRSIAKASVTEEQRRMAEKEPADGICYFCAATKQLESAEFSG
jgi:hypothetical protein